MDSIEVDVVEKSPDHVLKRKASFVVFVAFAKHCRPLKDVMYFQRIKPRCFANIWCKK